MPISDVVRQFLISRVGNGFFKGLRSGEPQKKRRNRSSKSGLHTEVFETRALLAAAMTSSISTDSTGIDDAESAPASAESAEQQIGKFIIFNRWSQTATSGSGLTQGDPTILTWSFPADGVTTDSFDNPDAPSNLLNFLDTKFGAGTGSDLTERPWFQFFDKSLTRLGELAGLTYNFVTYDDGVASHPANRGILDQRADVRIMGKSIDGPFNTLAYNAFPNDGDMTIDTSETTFFSNASNDHRAFRNVLMHEFMHGLGIDHTESSDAGILMEPMVDTSYDGPQLDDILALQRSYGDTLEKGAGNDTFATATDLGSVTSLVSRGTLGDSTSVSPSETDFVSIDDESDLDFYKFTVDAAGTVSINVTPRGATYSVGPQGGTQASFNSRNQSDLTVRLLGENGVTVLETRNTGGLGAAEAIENFMVSSPGTYFIQVTGATTNKIQLYGLDVSFTQPPGAQILGTVFNDVDADGTQDAGELGVQNVRVFVDANNSGTFDEGSESFVMTDVNGDYVFTDLDEGFFIVRTELPDNRQITTPGAGFYEVDLSLDEIISNIDFGTRALPVGTSGNDAFVLSYSGTNVTITLSTNSGPASLIGTFPLTSPLVVDGGAGTDSVRIVGTTGIDDFNVASANVVLTNNHQVTLSGIEQRTLAGAAGNDNYIFDTDAALGTFILDESGGGIDLLNFAQSDQAVNVNLAQSTLQVVNANLNLILGAANTFENVEGGNGADTLTGNALDNMLSGNAGDDKLAGLAGNDALKGGKGNDIYLFDADTQLGADSITELFDLAFLEGYDLLDFKTTTANLQVDLGRVTQQTVNSNLKLTLSANNVIDDVAGGSGDDHITGNIVSNYLDGHAGNDTLIGLGGNDELNGMGGNDTYVYTSATGQGFDFIEESASDGIDTLDFSALTSDVQVNLGVTTPQTANSNFSLQIFNAFAIENVIGGSGDDTITGNALVNNLSGGPGNDRLSGITAGDTLVGGNGNDTYVFTTAISGENNVISEAGTNGIDTLDFSSMSENVSVNLGTTSTTTFQRLDTKRFLRLNLGSTIENVIGGSGDDTITGNAHVNNLSGGPGNDRLSGITAGDTLVGGNGNDTYVFTTAISGENNVISEAGTNGIDTLDFSSMSENVSVNLGTTSATTFQRLDTKRFLRLNLGSTIENVIGGSGNDTITGNALVNNLSGGPGNDRLSGITAGDTLVGGNGNDTYVFTTAISGENNVISEAGTNGIDTLDFSSMSENVSVNLGTTSATTFQRLDTKRFLRLNSGSTIENVIGGSGNDTITGNALVNNLSGGPGNDRLSGITAGDTLVGGNGNDTYVFTTAISGENNVISEAGTNGIDTLDFSSMSENVSVNLGTTSATTFQRLDTKRFLRLNLGSTIENVIGGSGNDTITGNALVNNLSGGPGNDRLSGITAGDTLVGGNGNDTYVFTTAISGENNVISEAGTNGIDTLDFSSMSENVSINLGTTSATTFQRLDTKRFLRLNLGSTIENVIGGSGDDTITGNALVNNLSGGPGHDRLAGMAGDDVYIFEVATTPELDVVVESASAGNDTLDFSATADLLISLEVSVAQSVQANRTLTLQSAAAIENVIGGSGNDVLIGNSLSNRLTGNNGRDILVGNQGGDFLFGGNDDDILVSGFVNIAAMSTNSITFAEFYLALRQSWIGTLAYAERVQRINAPQSPSAGKVVYLLPITQQILTTVIPRNTFEDGVRDELNGHAGLDFFFSGAIDAILDRLSGEVLDVVTAP